MWSAHSRLLGSRTAPCRIITELDDQATSDHCRATTNMSQPHAKGERAPAGTGPRERATQQLRWSPAMGGLMDGVGGGTLRRVGLGVSWDREEKSVSAHVANPIGASS